MQGSAKDRNGRSPGLRIGNKALDQEMQWKEFWKNIDQKYYTKPNVNKIRENLAAQGFNYDQKFRGLPSSRVQASPITNCSPSANPELAMAQSF